MTQSRLGLSVVRRSCGSIWTTLSADPVIPLTSSPYRHRWGVALLASCAFASATLPSLGVWLDLSSRIAFCGLLAVVMLTSAIRRASTLAAEGSVMPASFVLDFAVLLLFGPNAAMTTAATGLLVERLATPRRTDWVPRLAVNGASATVGIQLAGFVYRLCGGAAGELSWPWQGAPIGLAVITYCCARGVAIRVLTPALTRQPDDGSWLQRAIASGPSYIVGGSVAAALAELIARQAWEILAVAAVPLYFGYQLYSDYVERVEDELHRKHVAGFLDEGLAVLDHAGRVTLWSDALEHLLGCRRERVLGCALVAVGPSLNVTDLQSAIDDTLSTGSARTLTLSVRAQTRVRAMQVKILPSPSGVTLLWRDSTERMQAERDLKRKEERLALAAEGANDGWWEWDLRTDEIYLSARWRAMLGLSATNTAERPTAWFERVHPDDVESLTQAIQEHLSGESPHLQHQHRIRHEDGDYRRVMCRGIVARGAGRRPVRVAGSLSEVVEPVAEPRERSDAAADPLTGLANRATFVQAVGRRLDAYKAQVGGDRFAVLYLDVDRFKIVNDSLGHLVGDELLIAVSRRLEACLRPSDSLARLGGDEFTILLNGLGDDQQANVVAFRIQDALSTPFTIDGREVFSSVSIGIAPGLRTYANADDIMRDADTAMYHAKRRGKARHEMFDADMHARVQDRLSLENDLRHAVNRREFEVHYQPIVHLETGKCIGFESLLRWTRNGEPVSPDKFIPIAEELGIIIPLGTWVLQQACQTFADWKRRFPDRGLECVTINASGRQLMEQDFVSLVRAAVDDAGLEPAEVRIEITETTLMDSPGEAAEVLRRLRAFGVKIYLDDFGTGYSSLNHLHTFRVDALKIDRSFVNSLLLPDRPAIVESILALARTLNTSVVAEGIESDQQVRELRRLGCTHAQGYYFSRPLATEAVEKLLTANQSLAPKPVVDLDYYPTGPVALRPKATRPLPQPAKRAS
ncbi:MAG: EAL domain-containing protein [Vicinamibacterales bacterium]